MTPRQQQLLAFIRDYFAEHGICPTYSEMMTAMGLASREGVWRMVSRLVEAGYLLRTTNSHRNLALPMPNLTGVPTAVLEAELRRRERSS